MSRYALRIIYTLLLLIPSLSFANVDSVGIETIEGNTYILHRVEQSEGFYGIARKYKISVSELQTANPREGNALKLGEILRVPYHKQSVPSKIITNVQKEEVKKENTQVAQTNTPESYQAKHTHKVGKGETLFSISKKYNVTVAQVKEWNNLTSNNLKLGQELIIQKSSIQIPLNPEAERPVITSSQPAPSVPSKIDAYTNSIERTENGMASWLNDKNLNPQKSIALHKSAPIGTVIKVTNKMNNRSIYVKVIGTLPETGDNTNTIIVVSKAAAGMLDVRDPKFQVTLNYSVPKE